MITFVLFDYDSSEDWKNFDELTKRIRAVRSAGYLIENKNGEDLRNHRTKVVVHITNDDEAMLFKLKFL